MTVPPRCCRSGTAHRLPTVRRANRCRPRSGPVDFLAKPFRDQDMLDAAPAALARDRARRSSLQELAALHDHFKSLTAREREILAHVTSGLMNKQIAAEVGLSEITVKIHRGNLMRK